MAKKPETQFISSIHTHIPRRSLYRMKNHNVYTDGIPDVWYSGSATDLWIEYKFTPVTKPRTQVVPDLSANQFLWIKGRRKEGRKVWVVVGSKKGGTIFNDIEEMLSGISAEEYLDRLLSREQLASTILKFCNGAEHD